MAMKQSELRAVMSLINEARENAKFQRELIFENLRERCIDPDKLEQAMHVAEDRNPLKTAGVDNLYAVVALEGAEEIIKGYMEDREDITNARTLWLEEAIKDVETVIKSEEDIQDLAAEASTEMKSYAEYVSSEKYDQQRQRNLELWKEMLVKETDYGKRRRLEHAIKVTENRFSISFMFERLHNEKTAASEKQALIDVFFDNRKSRYMIDKFISKCEQFGVSKDVYHYLLNIEENFLEEKYHVFNNFFLHAAMRYIGHCGYEESDEMKTIIQNLLNLVYNRYYSDEVKEIFLTSIRSFLDMFEDVRDIFDEGNILHPGHPYRIQKEKEREAGMRKDIYEKLDEMLGAMRPPISDLDEKSIPELIEYYNEQVKICNSSNEDPAEDSGDDASEESEGEDVEADAEVERTIDESDEEHEQ